MSLKSLRSGQPSKFSTVSSRGARPGWPSKTTPNMSHASRSCQFAPRYTGVSEGSRGSSRPPGATARSITWWPWVGL
jgi:hypothetical protein